MMSLGVDDYINANGEIPIRLTPNAPKNAIEGWVEDASGARWLKVKVTAVPEDGKANAMLLKFLAKTWKIAPSKLELVAGDTQRLKRVKYLG
jgi:uncharacterized protein